MMTNYYDRTSSLDCPKCGGSMTVVLKREARAFKYWHVCHNKDDCGFESTTRWGPKADQFVSDAEMEKYGVADAEEALYHDELVHTIADGTAEYADENPAF